MSVAHSRHAAAPTTVEASWAARPAVEEPPVGGLPTQYAWYVAGIVLQKVAGFVLMPVYTSRLSTEQYGALEILQNIVGLGSMFVALSVPAALNKCYHRDCRTRAERRDMVGTALIATLLLIGVTTGVGLLTARPLSRRIFGTADYAAAVQLAMLSLALLQMTMIAFELSRTLGEARRYFVFSVIQLAVQISASVFLIVGLGWNLEGVLFANVLASATVFLASGGFLWRHSRLRLSRAHLARLMAFGLAMMPGASASWITGVSDRFFLQHYAGAAAVGVYALGYKFGSLIEVGLILPFQKAWNPFFFALTDERHARQLLSRMFTYYVGWLVLGVAAISLAGGPLVQLMAGIPYREAARVIPVVAVGYLFVGITSLLGTGLIVANRLRIVAAISAIGAAVNLILNVALIPAYGMMGAAYATLLSFVVAAAMAGLAVRRWYRVDLEVRRLFIIAITASVLVLMGLQIHVTAPLGELAARVALFGVVPFVAWGTGFLTDPERERIDQAWRTCRSYLRSA